MLILFFSVFGGGTFTITVGTKRIITKYLNRALPFLSSLSAPSNSSIPRLISFLLALSYSAVILSNIDVMTRFRRSPIIVLLRWAIAGTWMWCDDISVKNGFSSGWKSECL